MSRRGHGRETSPCRIATQPNRIETEGNGGTPGPDQTTVAALAPTCCKLDRYFKLSRWQTEHQPSVNTESDEVLVNNRGVLPVQPHPSVPDGYLALDTLQRMEVKVSQHKHVQVAPYAPEKPVMVTLKLDTVEIDLARADQESSAQGAKNVDYWDHDYEGGHGSYGHTVSIQRYNSCSNAQFKRH
ncbi:unnamed protein product [Calypogeia fissa]